MVHRKSQVFCTIVPCLLIGVWQSSTALRAEVTNVIVGITPTCPYGITGCWSGARAALGALSGVRTMPNIPDAYNCTAEVQLSSPRLPDVDRWESEFKKSVGDVYGFRGVEVTVTGFLEMDADALLFRSTETDPPIHLSKFKHKLQYNFRKRRARGAEPEEQVAYDELLNQFKKAPDKKVAAEIVGPLRGVRAAPIIEVREGYLLEP